MQVTSCMDLSSFSVQLSFLFWIFSFCTSTFQVSGFQVGLTRLHLQQDQSHHLHFHYDFVHCLGSLQMQPQKFHNFLSFHFPHFQLFQWIGSIFSRREMQSLRKHSGFKIKLFAFESIPHSGQHFTCFYFNFFLHYHQTQIRKCKSHENHQRRSQWG